MPEGEMREQITEGKNAEFLPEQVGLLGSYSLEIFDGAG